MKTKGIIYYTDCRVVEPIFSTVQDILLEMGLPISSTSLKPITPKFTNNKVMEGLSRGYVTYIKQIHTALLNAKEDYIFFCENDVLYHKSHFDFTPPLDNVFYYNSNVWRWRLWDDKAIRYKGMLPLSCLCVNREFAIKHYQLRLDKIKEWGYDEFRSREPRRSRIWGYEPGTKKKRRGGLTNDDHDTWCSDYPNVDIRHKRTFSRLKCTKDDFRHQPEEWEEINSAEISGWNLKKVFNNWGKTYNIQDL